MSRARDLANLGGSADAGGLTGRNLIINGAMKVAQRGTSSTGVGATGNVFPCIDRVKIFAGSTAGRATLSQVADGPDGFANSLKFECTTPDTSIAAGENFGLIQILEGQDVQHLKKGTSGAESLTLSFYVKGNASATYTAELKDNDNDRHITQTFDVTTSWNRVSLTFVPDTTGALDDDDEGSFQFGIWLHAGATYTGGTFASNTWAARVNANRVPPSATSFFDSTDRTFFITGVQLEVGQKATPFEHEDYGTTLTKCQRYCFTQAGYGRGDIAAGDADVNTTKLYSTISINTSGSIIFFNYPTTLRKIPNLTYTAAGGGVVDQDFSTPDRLGIRDTNDVNWYIYDFKAEAEL